MTTTGTDVLRAALAARSKKGALVLLARELNVGVGALEEFCFAKGKLPDAILQTLAREMLGSNVHLDVERDLLVRAKQPWIPAPVLPPRYVPKTPTPTGRFSGFPASHAKPQPKNRPGWAD